jgi:hypothetical protein
MAPKDRERRVPASPKHPTQPVEPKLSTPIVAARVEESRRERRKRAEDEVARQEAARILKKQALFEEAMQGGAPRRHPHERILRNIAQDPSLTRKQQNHLRAALSEAHEDYIYTNGYAAFATPTHEPGHAHTPGDYYQ